MTVAWKSSGRVSVVTSGVIIAVVAVTLQMIVVVESASRQEQEILLLDALSRKYSPASSSNQFEPNSIMDMLGRSTED